MSGPPVLPSGLPSRTRRGVATALVGGVAVAAGAAGYWAYISGVNPAADLQVRPAASDALPWQEAFATPDGKELRLASYRGKPLVINFWATWCPPCVEEMPELDAFFREKQSKNWQVIGLAIDQPSAVRSFLTKVPVSFPIGLAGLSGTDLVRALGNASGGLPFTVLVGPEGRVRQRKMGKTSLTELKTWAEQLL